MTTLNRYGLLAFLMGLFLMKEFNVAYLLVALIGAIFFVIPWEDADGPDSQNP